MYIDPTHHFIPCTTMTIKKLPLKAGIKRIDPLISRLAKCRRKQVILGILHCAQKVLFAKVLAVDLGFKSTF